MPLTAKLMEIVGSRTTLTPQARAPDAASPPAVASWAPWRATKPEEHAVLIVEQGPWSPSTKERRPEATDVKEPDDAKTLRRLWGLPSQKLASAQSWKDRPTKMPTSAARSPGSASLSRRREGTRRATSRAA